MIRNRFLTVYDFSACPILEVLGSFTFMRRFEKGMVGGRFMVGSKGLQAFVLVAVMVLAPLSGCFGENMSARVNSESDVVITPETLSGGVFQGLTIAAEKDLSAFVPYLILNEDSGYVQNSTVVDLRAGESVLLNVLAPPRTNTALVLIGDFGRDTWPIRAIDESWKTWYERGGHQLDDNPGITRAVSYTHLTLPTKA